MDKVQAALRDLERFHDGASHDLRAPLRAILSLAEITLEDAGAQMDPDVRMNLEAIAKSAAACAGRVDELLRLAGSVRERLAAMPADAQPTLGS